MRDIFDPLFDLQDARLKKLGNPFEELQYLINWEVFRPELDTLYQKERKSKAGAKPKDVVMMFKGLVIQNLYGLSDDQLEYQIEDRRSFQRFLGLNKQDRSPDAKTFWAFREKLTQLELIEILFKTFFRQLNQAGYIARKGQIIDASFVPVPRQHNKRSENEEIKEGKTPKSWSDNKRRQKETDARWTKKNNKSTFGFKNHLEVDNQHKLIRHYAVTDASVYDSNVFEELVDHSNTSKDLWGDSAYRSREKEAWLKKNGYRSRIQRKGTRNKPLTQWELQGNRTRSKVRSRVEHIFGAQCHYRVKAIRSIGMARAKMNIGLMNLTYNLKRFCFLQRSSVS